MQGGGDIFTSSKQNALFQLLSSKIILKLPCSIQNCSIDTTFYKKFMPSNVAQFGTETSFKMANFPEEQIFQYGTRSILFPSCRFPVVLCYLLQLPQYNITFSKNFSYQKFPCNFLSFTCSIPLSHAPTSTNKFLFMGLQSHL